MKKSFWLNRFLSSPRSNDIIPAPEIVPMNDIYLHAFNHSPVKQENIIEEKNIRELEKNNQTVTEHQILLIDSSEVTIEEFQSEGSSNNVSLQQEQNEEEKKEEKDIQINTFSISIYNLPYVLSENEVSIFLRRSPIIFILIIYLFSRRSS
jgi:hypothetical protein